MNATLIEAADRIAAADKLLITCHLGPDGDSVGSMVALASMLRATGKRATLYNPDLVPRRLKWLPLVKTMVHRLRSDARYDATIVVDCGDPKLLGDSFPGKEVTGDVIALDHHSSGVAFGDYFVCDPEAACVGVLVARIANRLGWELTEEAGVGLFVSLVSDTGSFRYSNTNGEALRLAGRLVEIGVDPWSVSERMHERVSIGKYRLLAAALGTLELAIDGKVSFMQITHAMVKAAKSSWEDSEGVVNYARAIDGVDCGVLLTPAKTGGTRVSMRSKGRLIDAGAVCKELGGGGHVGAAGCTLDATMVDARAIVEKALAAAVARAED